MGGNAFKNYNLQRINRADIAPTLRYLAHELAIEKFDLNYMLDHVLGSVGKQADSGDIDISIDSAVFTFDEYRDLAFATRRAYGESAVKTAFKASQVNCAIPINGNPKLGYVQVDYIYGNDEWLKFTHWSPGKERSPWKGVFISQTMGVLAKMKVLYRYPEDAVVDMDNGIDERIAEVSYAYNLEHGLYTRWRLSKQDGGGLKVLDADTFETKCPVVPPRFPRRGYITNPETILEILIAPGVKPSDVETFEDLLAVLRSHRDDEWWEQFKDRLASSLMRSAARKECSEEELRAFLDTF